MLRLGELLLAAAPVLLAALLYAIVIGRHRPSARLMTLAILAVASLGAWLVWQGTAEDLPRGESYRPAILRDGQIIQGHGALPQDK